MCVAPAASSILSFILMLISVVVAFLPDVLRCAPRTSADGRCLAEPRCRCPSFQISNHFKDVSRTDRTGCCQASLAEIGMLYHGLRKSRQWHVGQNFEGKRGAVNNAVGTGGPNWGEPATYRPSKGLSLLIRTSSKPHLLATRRGPLPRLVVLPEMSPSALTPPPPHPITSSVSLIGT